MMKKIIVLIAVLLSMALLLAGCAKKPITIEDFAGNWKVKDSTIYGEPNNLGKFSNIASQYSPPGGIRISGDRICLYRDFEYDMPAGDFCTFDVKDGRLVFRDLGMEVFIPIGDFESKYILRKAI